MSRQARATSRPASSQRLAVVAQAEPSTPSAGTGPCPKISSQLRPALARLATTIAATIARGPAQRLQALPEDDEEEERQHARARGAPCSPPRAARPPPAGGRAPATGSARRRTPTDGHAPAAPARSTPRWMPRATPGRSSAPRPPGRRRDRAPSASPCRTRRCRRSRGARAPPRPGRRRAAGRPRWPTMTVSTTPMQHHADLD